MSAGPLSELGAAMLADSERWFPVLHGGQHAAVTHFALGMGGEVGEATVLGIDMDVAVAEKRAICAARWDKP